MDIFKRKYLRILRIFMLSYLSTIRTNLPSCLNFFISQNIQKNPTLLPKIGVECLRYFLRRTGCPLYCGSVSLRPRVTPGLLLSENRLAILFIS